MRFLIAMMKHETNSFSPVPTPLARFSRHDGQPLRGNDAIAAYRGTGTVTGAFIALADREGAEIVMPIAAEAWPSGFVEDAGYAVMTEDILAAARQGGYDGIMLDLHGAMITESQEDGEGTLMARLRAVVGEVKIAVGLDMHANLYPEIVEHGDIVCGYQTYPHIDMFETGMRAGELLLRTIRGEIDPVMAWGRAPMIPHVMRQSSLDEPNRSLQARAIAMEEQGEALAASLFVGFPHADISGAGLSVVTICHGDGARAITLRNELLDMAWDKRHDFVYHPENLAASVARARQSATPGTIVLLDHYDNAASGGTMDTTAVLAEILQQGLDRAVFFAVYDPKAVEQAIAAGPGAEISLRLGGAMRLTSIGKENPALPVRGRVLRVSDGRFRNRGPMARGVLQDMGQSVVLRVDGVDVAIVSRHIEPFDLNSLLALGLDPGDYRYVALKSRVHWRAGLGQIADEIVECAGLGVCTSDYRDLSFSRLNRPVFPLDEAMAWQAKSLS